MKRASFTAHTCAVNEVYYSSCKGERGELLNTILYPFCAGVLEKLESGKQVDLKNYCLIPPGSLQVDVSFDAYEVRMYSRLEKC